MNEKFNKNAKVEKFTNMLGIALRLIVIDPLQSGNNIFSGFLFEMCTYSIDDTIGVRKIRRQV